MSDELTFKEYHPRGDSNGAAVMACVLDSPVDVAGNFGIPVHADKGSVLILGDRSGQYDVCDAAAFKENYATTSGGEKSTEPVGDPNAGDGTSVTSQQNNSGS